LKCAIYAVDNIDININDFGLKRNWNGDDDVAVLAAVANDGRALLLPAAPDKSFKNLPFGNLYEPSK
jgi:hypothetical protein